MSETIKEVWFRAVRSNPILVIAALACIAMIALVAGSPPRYLYDERYYIQGAWLLAKGTSFRDLLLAPLNTPAGPLYPTLQWLFSPLTGLQPRAARIPNLVLLATTIGASAYAMARWRLTAPWARAAMILALPIIWVSAGMAFTEMPALAFASFSLAASAWAMSGPAEARTRIWLGFAIAGACFGLAILGRQPYLPAAGGFVLIAIFERRFRWPALLAAMLACAVPLPVFLLWGGLVAPQVAWVGGVDLSHGALAFAYLSALILILAPAYFMTRWKWSLIAGLVVGLAILPFGGLPATIAEGVAVRLPPLLAHLFQIGISVALVGGGASVIVASAVNLWTRRDDRIFVLMVLLTLGLTSTAASIAHQFSSRYLMAGFPFALFAVQPYFTPSRCAAARLAVGALCGYLSLAHYFNWAPPTG